MYVYVMATGALRPITKNKYWNLFLRFCLCRRRGEESAITLTDSHSGLLLYIINQKLVRARNLFSFFFFCTYYISKHILNPWDCTSFGPMWPNRPIENRTRILLSNFWKVFRKTIRTQYYFQQVEFHQRPLPRFAIDNVSWMSPQYLSWFNNSQSAFLYSQIF